MSAKQIAFGGILLLMPFIEVMATPQAEFP
jgi:hypothetical protein